MPTLFTRIIEGELPGHFIWRDDRAVAFLTINPVHRGHALVVPREVVDHWLDAPAGLLGHLMEVARAVGRAQQAAFPTERTALVVLGTEVPHLHFHVIPADGPEDVAFQRATAPDQAELAEVAVRLRAELSALGHGETAVA